MRTDGPTFGMRKWLIRNISIFLFCITGQDIFRLSLNIEVATEKLSKFMIPVKSIVIKTFISINEKVFLNTMEG